MADTARGVTALQALLADNSNGAVSPQDVRDMLVSLVPAHGELTITASGLTTVSVLNTWYNVSGTWTLTATFSDDFDEPAEGRLRYIGTPTRTAFVIATISTTAADNNQVIEWGIAKNGTIISESIISRKQGTGADVGALAVQAITTLATNDYLTVQARNTTSTGDLTARYCSLIVEAVIQ